MSALATKQQVMAALYPAFKEDSRFVLLVGDMGFAVLDDYFDNHPDRTFNVGICEQAMISMAAGMCMTGLRPIVYSQAPFLILRAFEQIRYDIAEHQWPIILVGVGADNYFEKLGRSHCVDDLDKRMMACLGSSIKLVEDIQTVKKDSFFKDLKFSYIRCI